MSYAMKSIGLKLFLLNVLLTLYTETFAQPSGIVPPSPEASALIRSINLPVEKYTGVAGISVPLHTINFKSLEIPLSLNYQASGIKVQDYATCIGLGWRLIAGGKITRVMKKSPDEQGYVGGDGAEAANLSSWASENAFKERYQGDFDGEPDLFYFEIPGRSGCFIMDFTGKAYTIPYQYVKIEWVQRRYFVLTDELGNKYTFGKKAYETTLSKSYSDAADSEVKEQTFTSTWMLDEIEDSNHETMSFSYQTGGEVSYVYHNQTSSFLLTASQYDNGECAFDLDGKIEEEEVQDKITEVKISAPCYLQSIQWSGGSVDFIYSPAGCGVANSVKLEEIQLYSVGEHYLKSFRLRYDSFAREGGIKELKLLNVAEVKNKEELPVCRFAYNESMPLPDRNTNDFDHWGYYNGMKNTTFRPLFEALGGLFLGANRQPSLKHTLVGVLNGIYYNTGGYVEYKYGLNQAEWRSNTVLVGGLRVVRMKQCTGNGEEMETRYVYENEDGTTSGEIFNGNFVYVLYDKLPVEIKACQYVATCESRSLSHTFDLNGSPVGYSRVVEISPNLSYTVSEYTNYNNDRYSDQYSTIYNIANMAEWYYNRLTYIPNTTSYWKRGLLWRETEYDIEGKEIACTRYYYNTDPAPKAVISGFLPYTVRLKEDKSDKLLCKYNWISQPLFLDSMVVKGRDKPDVTTSYRYDPEYLLMKEEQQRSALETYCTKYSYAYSFVGISPLWDDMFDRHMINYPVETVHYKNFMIIDGSVNEYKQITTMNASDAIVLDKNLQLKLSFPVDDYSICNATPAGLVKDSRYEMVYSYDKYDLYGNLIHGHAKDGNIMQYQYGYGHSLPVAVVDCAHPVPFFYTSFEEEEGAVVLTTAKTGRKAWKNTYRINLGKFGPGSYVLTYWHSKDGVAWEKITLDVLVQNTGSSVTIGDGTAYLDEIRVMPEEARMNTYTYLPGVGKTSETDTHGNTVYYEYDNFGRLITVRNNRREIVKEYFYHYAQ